MPPAGKNSECPPLVTDFTASAVPAALTWPFEYGYVRSMKTIAAGKFKDACLKTLDDVSKTRVPVIITKRGRPIAKLVPYTLPKKDKSLVGSVLEESGDPFSTGETWNDDIA
jgi:antitoxin (DNA-binding transcriptional repressor) of toxin-antitoxin stability system